MHRSFLSKTPRLPVVMAVALLAAAVVSQAHAAVKPFAASFHAEQMQVTGGTQYVRVGGKARRCCCCTASATPATCGNRSPSDS